MTAPWGTSKHPLASVRINHRILNPLGFHTGESQTSVSSLVLVLARLLAPKPGNLSCIYLAQMRNWDPERLSTSLNALYTAILLFTVKAESNLNHLLVATKRTGNGAVNAVCSPVSPFSTAPIDETPCFSGDADTRGNKGLHLHNLCIYRNRGTSFRYC